MGNKTSKQKKVKAAEQKALDDANKYMEEFNNNYLKNNKPEFLTYLNMNNMELFDKQQPWKQLTFSRVHHSKNYDVISDTKVYGKAAGTTDNIALSQLFDCNSNINKIVFEIKPENRIEGNIIGILQYPLPYDYTYLEPMGFNEEKIQIGTNINYG